MGEDESRARAGHAPENLATLRRLALNLLRRDKTKKRGIHGKRLTAAWDHQYILHLLSSKMRLPWGVIQLAPRRGGRPLSA